MRMADRMYDLENQMKQLEKENAELKKELEISQRCWQDQKNISLDTNCKLYKAKKIIKNLMVFAEMDDREYEKEYKEAEQFLNEVEE